jgi:hypothetical protein
VKLKTNCDTSGSSGGADAEACTQAADIFFNDNAPVSDDTDLGTTNSVVDPYDPNTRTKLYSWICARSSVPGGWYETSVELGTHQKVDDFNWKWVSLVHSGQHLSGMAFVGTVSFDVAGTNGVITNDYNAHMQMSYGTTLSFSCADLLPVTIHYGPYPATSPNWNSNL